MRENRGQKKLLLNLLANNSISQWITIQIKVAYIMFQVQLVATKSNSIMKVCKFICFPDCTGNSQT